MTSRDLQETCREGTFLHLCFLPSFLHPLPPLTPSMLVFPTFFILWQFSHPPFSPLTPYMSISSLYSPALLNVPPFPPSQLAPFSPSPSDNPCPLFSLSLHPPSGIIRQYPSPSYCRAPRRPAKGKGSVPAHTTFCLEGI